ncbi:hypothetical protein AMELA_G00259070 [Ameiurus melas]|uniref:Protein translocase subunit SecA n=1 Tax=Ameiurus melas TaxID=219545 RepID=A0A7J5ZSB3_AMEME|nr:hypothetical protein AMELA_G00259070 [Ameiurus melas]
MGVTVSVQNKTPYTWHFATQNKGFTRLDPFSETSYEESRVVHRYIYFRYKDHTWDSFKYEFNTHKGSTTFILRETYDRSQIELHCTSEGITHYCTNYGKTEEDEILKKQAEERERLERLERERRFREKIEEDERRKKQAEERERLERLERERRIQEELNRESESSRQKLSQATQWLREKQRFRGQEQHHERTRVLHQQIEDDAAAIERDEVIDVEEKFKELLLKYQITEDKEIQHYKIWGRIKTLQNELAVQYCRENNLSVWSQFTFDHAVGYNELSLTEKLTVLEASLQFILYSSSEDTEDEEDQLLGWEKKNDFLLALVEQLQATNPTLAERILLNVLDTISDLSPQKQVKYIPEKDAEMIVKELCEANCPEKVLVPLKDVLRYLESELPKCESKELTNINDLKRKIRSLNLTDPDINVLKDVLIGMSLAVRNCTTTTGAGYFPRRTQLASLLLLLLAKLTHNKGSLLEIGTGEGKSCILAMFATIMAIRETKVDIVTSSPLLARRDQEVWSKLFQMFGVTSSVVPPPFSGAFSPEKHEEDLKNAYRQQIVYGTVGVFAADTLKQEFEKRITRDERNFELVIVDEVDDMTLDNGVQVTFLSHESSGFRHVEQVLSNIWAMISACQPIEMLETGEIKWAARIQYFHKAVTAAVMGLETESFSANEILLPGVTLGFYTQEDIEMIRQAESKKENEDGMSKALSEVMKKLGVSEQYDLLSIFEEVLENSAVFKCYSLENKKAKCFHTLEKQGDLNVEMLLLDGGLACEILSEKSLIDATVSTIKSFIKYSDNLQTAKESHTYIVVPSFLKSYVENQLEVFVRNALRAVEMSLGREYMIDTSQAAEQETDRHECNVIIPVDFKASGVLEKNKKWGNGLQQFLEFKHQLAISPISNVTNYMSNFHYFKRYLSGSGIFGVSGTLGGKADQEFLAKHYEAKSYTVPAHRHKCVVELPVIQVKGQSVEIMRQLREDYEIKRIQDMESDELLEINLKEKLFSTFCTLLKNFDGHYSPKERLDPMQMPKLNKIPDCFKVQHKFDYQPAVNAMKESWALWLTLHEEHINRHDDFSLLEADLIRTMDETSGQLLRGECDNFYDHVRQAIVRTALYCKYKSGDDFGAKSYWQKVASFDPHYKAVALYNLAYITINLGKGNYKADAMNLLEDAKESIDVYVSEVSNTMVSCNISVTGNNEHRTDNNNFQSQMEARMNIFKSWRTYIDNALTKLQELKETNNDAITEDCSVYMLSGEKNFIVTNELRSLYDYGLGVVFEVKQKPKFCLDALICFILGVVQVLAGILVCALTLGAASQFGMGLISEGVSDMINGIEGMIKGTFDWVSWAISKSISIGLALLTAGFSVIKKAVTTVFKAAKSLLNGTKSFSSVASEFIKSGKATFMSLKGSVQSGVSSLTQTSFKSALKNMASSTAFRQNFKHATKYAVQELVKQSVVTAMNYAIDKALQEVLDMILRSSFKNVVTSSVKENSKLDLSLTEFISSGVPKAALEKVNFKIDQKYETQIQESVAMLCEDITPHLIMDCTTALEVISKLSEVCDAATEIMGNEKGKGVFETAKLILKVAEYRTRLEQILAAIPTKKIIDQKFVPEFLESISELQKCMTEYDQDGRHNLHDVQRLKNELLQIIAEKVSEQFISSCSEHITSLLTSTFKSQLNSAVGQAVDNVTSRLQTQRFFSDQRQKHNERTASHKEPEQLSDVDITQLMRYVEDMSGADQPATALDVYVLTKSNLLHGKGIQLAVVDENGKPLTEERYPGTSESAGDIKLRLTKSASARIHHSKSGH